MHFVKRCLHVGGKLLATAGMIACIGAVVVLDESGDPSTSRAEILSLAPGAPTNEKRFLRSLESVGHEDLHTYEVNGQTIHVSTKEFDASPRRALRRYQREFARRGLNDEPFYELKPGESMARHRAALTGGLVPAMISPRKVVMRGVLMPGRPDDYDDLLKQFARSMDRDGPLAGRPFEGFRWIEINQRRGSPLSRALAIWSGEDFDYARMTPGNDGDSAERVDRRIPRCPDCRLVHQFSDTQHEGLHETYVFTSPQSRRQLRHFYRERLEERDWNRTPSTDLFARVQRRIDMSTGDFDRLRYERKGHALYIDIYPVDGRRAVRVRLVDETFTQANRKGRGP